MTCYCGSDRAFADCCQPYHVGQKSAETAVVLMRSRYSAFVAHDAAYLLATWDVNKCPDSLAFSDADDRPQWQKLDIIRCHKGREDHSQGTVEFKAYYQQNGQNWVLHEISRFKKDQGRWLYIDGAVKVKPAM